MGGSFFVCFSQKVLFKTAVKFSHITSPINRGRCTNTRQCPVSNNILLKIISSTLYKYSMMHAKMLLLRVEKLKNTARVFHLTLLLCQFYVLTFFVRHILFFLSLSYARLKRKMYYFFVNFAYYH